MSYFLHRRVIATFYLTMALQAGAVVSSGQTATPQPKQQKAAAPAQPASQRPVRVIADLSGFHIDQAQRSQMLQLGAATRGSVSRLTLCAPASGTTSSARPLFEWRTPDGGAAGSGSSSRVTFSLLNQEGDVVYENDVTGTSLEYPADAPALEPGQTYSWKVSGGDLSRLPPPVSVKLLNQAETDALQPQLATVSDPLARAQVYIKGGLWYDSVAALEAAIQAHPERKDLPDQLTKLYQRVAPSCSAPASGRP